MNKILELLIEDFGNRKMSAKYQLVLNRICEAQDEFTKLLNEEQKNAYLEFSFIEGELGLIELEELAQFLYENLRKHFN